jgi:hypothetical protein
VDRETLRAGAREAGTFLIAMMNLGLWLGFGNKLLVQGLSSDTAASLAFLALCLGSLGSQWAISRAIWRLGPPCAGVLRTN